MAVDEVRVARDGGRMSPFGAFYDSTLDRVGESVMFGGIIVFFMGVIFWARSDDMTIPELEKAYKPVKKLRWWKTLLTGSTVLAAYAYVDWTGPAIVYFIAMLGIVGGATILRSAINTAMEQHKESNLVHEDDA